MVDLKITVDQLKNYLGTGLKVAESEYITRELVGLHNSQPILHDYGYTTIKKIKPICYRLSDLDKEIEHNGERFVPIDMLNKRSTALTLYRMETENKTCLIFDTAVHGYNVLSSFNKVQQLFEWHFWPFGDEYFEHGLVIDKRKDGSNV